MFALKPLLRPCVIRLILLYSRLVTFSFSLQITNVLFQDFEKSGVFDAQNDLEQIQKVEEDLLYSTFRRNREKKIKKLEADLQEEQEQSVAELVSSFERIASQMQSESKLAEETKKLEEEYTKKKQSMIKDLLETMTAEERNQVAQLIEKHSQQMLALISEKLSVKQVRH